VEHEEASSWDRNRSRLCDDVLGQVLQDMRFRRALMERSFVAVKPWHRPMRTGDDL
jgi:hypothetical protein